ncbi:MAG: TonB-dependent receptor [Chitinophagaceae bacterium]|nr:TonB-dependent receptor [Chitinophagaceae bacterium]
MISQPNGKYMVKPWLSFIVLSMKLTVMLLTTFVLQVSAKSYSQQLTINQKNISVATLLQIIEKQTDYHFLYDNLQMKDMVIKNISLNGASVEDVLNESFKDLPLSYKIVRKTIVVKRTSEIFVTSPPLNQPDKQQSETISGLVTDAGGTPLQKVSVIEKGTANGTTTDAAGGFSITVHDKKSILLFSYVGFQSQEITVGNQSYIKVTLAPVADSLTDIVVVGYGKQKKSDLTGSISSLKGKDVTDLGTQRVDQALQGKASGVLVLNTDGAPGGNTTIRVRGMNSVLGGNNALVVIDGLQGGSLNNINPNDIESIEILKDASATAIYGSQGANGVILITTKLGRKGKPTITYDGFYGIQKILKTLPIMSGLDFAKTVNANKQSQNGNGFTPPPVFTDHQLDSIAALGFGVNWQDVIYRNAPLQNHALSIAGGTENTKYMVSGGYLDQKGIMVNSFYKRFTVRANLQTDITDWASFSVNWSAAKEQGNAPSFGSAGDVAFNQKPANSAPRWDPLQPIYNPDGSYHRHDPGYGAYDVWNPLASAVEPKIDNNTITNNLFASLDFKILKGLTLRISGGGSIGDVDNNTFNNLKTGQGLGDNGLGLLTRMSWRYYQNSNILTYDRYFGRHHLTLTGVQEQSSNYSKYELTTAKNFATDITGNNDLSGVQTITIYKNNSYRQLQSYMGRINYSFDDKYLLTASIRGDGSSVFGANNKWGYFPSFSVAWNVANENFMKDQTVVSNLKLRYSWGITGNQAIRPYQTFATIGSGAYYPYNGLSGTDVGYYVASPANPNLKWENTTQNNYGIDLGFFNNRLNITADYYTKHTRDLLMYRSLPNYTGYNNLIDNVGSMQNKGIELMINGDILDKELKWNSGFTISSNKNKVLSLGEYERIPFYTSNGGYGIGDVDKPLMYLIAGHSMGEMVGYKFLGIWNTKEQAEAAKFGQLPGDEKFLDANGDGKINVEDIVVIGNAMPKYIFGWNNRLSYKGFDLNFLIQGSQGNDLFNIPRVRMEASYEGTSARLLNRWTVNNQNTDVPAITDDLTRQAANLTSQVNIGFDNRSSRWVEDASYVRLQNVTLGYTLPANIIRRIHFKTIRVYVSATNLYTWTKYKGYTPEVSSYNENDASIGVDFSSYPQSRIVNVGLNLSF